LSQKSEAETPLTSTSGQSNPLQVERIMAEQGQCKSEIKSTIVLQTAGSALRNGLFANIRSILGECDAIVNSQARLAIQSSCLDLIASMEDVIDAYGLDQ
jgi:hypothetical protein